MKYKFCVSGAAETDHCPLHIQQKAEELGKAIAQRDIVLVNGATTGFPLFAAKSAKEAGGFVIGISPAETEKEHKERYHLPLEHLDIIVYTGFGYSGRNLLLTRSADAVIVGCGRMGTLNEFTIAFEERKPIGILEGPWEIDELIKEMVEKSHRGPGKIVYSKDPRELVHKLLKRVAHEEANHRLRRKKFKRSLWGGD